MIFVFLLTIFLSDQDITRSRSIIREQTIKLNKLDSEFIRLNYKIDACVSLERKGICPELIAEFSNFKDDFTEHVNLFQQIIKRLISIKSFLTDDIKISINEKMNKINDLECKNDLLDEKINNE